jgi:hypothetical protein
MERREIQRGNPVQLREACEAIYAEYKADGKKPGSEHWIYETNWRRKILLADIEAKWRQITSTPKKTYPFSDDYVIEVYVKHRKTTSKPGEPEDDDDDDAKLF